MILSKALLRYRVLHWVVILALLFSALLAPAPVVAASPNIVISQVYGGGGNSGATYKNDFVELFNLGSTAVDITGWTVQYASAAGTTWTNITALAGTIQPGAYYLVQEAAGAGGTTPLPTPDATGNIAMSASNGKVALVNNSTALIGSCPTGMVDFVGFGSANCYEGAGATGALSNPTAALRNGSGCTDTDNNASDFTVSAPAPRNSASSTVSCAADTAPYVSNTAPANGATGVSLNADITVTFSEAVNVIDPWFTLICTTSGTHTATVSGGPVTFTLNPDADFVGGETCTLTIDATKVSDQDSNDPPDTMAVNFTAGYTTAVPPIAIHDVQGASHVSALTGQTVTLLPSIVTALRTAGSTRGFYVQAADADVDADPATSEGVFVFTGGSSNPASLVTVGDKVQVSGKVSEYRSSSNYLTLTELGSPYTVTKLSSGNALPAPIILGTGGLIPPSTIIEDDATGNVETSGVFDPVNDGLDFYESLEGMLVQVNDAVATGPTDDFTSNREISVVGDYGANAGLLTNRGGVVIRSTDYNPERIILNDWIAGGPTLPMINVGAKFPGTTLGVMDYTYGNYKLEVISMPAVSDDTLAQEVTAADTLAELSVAAFNVENLSPTDDQSKFDTLADLVVNHLMQPDVLAVEEIQDNNGTTNDGTVNAATTWSTLITAIQTAGGPVYEYRQIDPVNDEDGGATGGNIRVGFLFRTDRGLSFVDRPGADATTANSVVLGVSGPELTYSPGRLDPTNTAFSDSRKPLAGEFMFRGHKVFIVANHFNSKGGDQPLEGRYQPPVLSSEVQRLQQAAVVKGFVQSILALDANANVIVLGDLNDFEFSNPIMLLKEAPLNALIETLPAAERYTYVYEGNSQAIDHTLFSNSLFARPFVYDVVHVNSEFYNQVSDHEPQVVRIALNDAPVVSAGGPYVVDEGGSVTVSASATDPESGTLGYAWDLDNDGTFETPGQNAVYAAVDGPAVKTLKVQATDDGGLNTVAEASLTINNLAPVAGSITGPTQPLKINQPVNVSASFTDAGVLDTHTAIWTWGDGTTSSGLISEVNGSGTVSGTHAYHAPGVYPIVLAVTDKDGASTQVTFEQVIYDPMGGFTIGAGWIKSLAGAYFPDTTKAGKASFGFAAAYKKGASVPIGEAIFKFRAVKFTFKAEHFNWLVVNRHDKTAQMRGTGTINGHGTYQFMIWVKDGKPDTFRIKIWQVDGGGQEVVLYDNGTGQRVTTGSVVVHK